MEGGDKSAGQASSYKWAAILVLFLTILGLGVAMRHYFPGPPPQTTSYVFFSTTEEQDETTKFFRASIRGTFCLGTGILLMVLTLWIYGKMNQVKGILPGIVSTSVFFLPLLLAGLVIFLVNLVDLGTVNSILTSLASSVGGISAVIFLYGAAKSVMNLELRQRYFVTLLAIIAFGIGFGISQQIINEIF
jgi:hypothetical protein